MCNGCYYTKIDFEKYVRFLFQSLLQQKFYKMMNDFFVIEELNSSEKSLLKN